MTVREKRAKRALTLEQAKALLAKAETEKRDLNAEEQATWTRLNGEIDRLGLEVEREERVAAIDAELRTPQDPNPPRPTPQDPHAPYGSAARVEYGWEAEHRSASRLWSEEERRIRTPESDLRVANWFRAFMRNDFEEMRRVDPQWAVEQRALQTGGGGGDGLITPGAFSQLVFLKEREVGSIRQFCTVVPTDQTSIKIPQEKTVPVAKIFAEGADMTSGVTDSDFEAVVLVPVKIGMISYMSRELVDDSPLRTVDLLASRAAHACVNVENGEILKASGGFTHNLIDDGTASADTWVDNGETLESIVSKLYELPQDIIPSSVWIINTASAKYLSTTIALNATDKSTRPIMLPFNEAPRAIGTGSGLVGTLAGRPVLVVKTGTGGLAVNTAILGDLRSCVIADRQQLYVEQGRGQGFNLDLFGLHVSRRVDFGIMQATHLRKYPAA